MKYRVFNSRYLVTFNKGVKMKDDSLFIGFDNILLEDMGRNKEKKRERIRNNHSKDKGLLNHPRGNPKHK